MSIVDYTPSEPLASAETAKYVPKFLYTGFPDPTGRPDVRIRDDFYGTRRKLRVGVVGAGISGLQFLHEARRLKNVEIVVYEKNNDVGGVVCLSWCSTTYPGCRCDFPSFVYQFRWHPYPWSEVYASQPELLRYFQHVARENDFYQHIRLRNDVLQASWSSELAQWTLRVRDLSSGEEFEDTVDIFVHLRGAVAKPKRLAYPGIDKFREPVVQPAEWPEGLDMEKKRVAVVGHGSTGVQILPNILDQAEKVYTWFRSATHILGPVAGENFKYSEEQRKLLTDRDIALAYRKSFEGTAAEHSSLIVNGSDISGFASGGVIAYMKEKLASKPEIAEALVPKDFAISCRRPAFNVGYLEALVHPKTTVLSRPPNAFTESGIIDQDGNEHDLDIIIAATGYDQSHSPHIPLLLDGHPVSSTWNVLPDDNNNAPPCYFGLLYQGIPNYLAPGSAFLPFHAGNYFQTAETTTSYIVSVISKVQLDRIARFSPRSKAVQQFVRHSQAWIKRTAMGGDCNAWYKGNDGSERPACLWPGGREQFTKALEVPRFEDFDIEYEDEGDMFAYLANGWDEATFSGDQAEDKTWYLGKPGVDVGEDVLEKLRKPEQK